ncbi:MAG TPA: MATE family efflux transporter [Candidatus Bathyarchaeia archaeon]|nr:MATE family efflux transporter [Candidatus Bathyarchaeia archaeon]
MGTRRNRLDHARRGLALELRPLVSLAAPVVATEVSWTTMGLISTMMVGRVSAEAIGAVSLGNSLFFAVAVFGLGMLLGLDYTVAHAFGAGRIGESHRALLQGVYLSFALAALLSGLFWFALPLLDGLGIEPEVLSLARPYLHALIWSLPPLLLSAALRRYLQAMGKVRPVMITAVSADLVAVVACWALVFGHLGAPAMGAEGAGWAICLSRGYVLLSLLLYLLIDERSSPTGLRHTPLRPDLGRLGRLVGLGFPSAMQLTFEVGVFATATTLVARLDAQSLAAHQIALSAASFTFMVPLGIASAAAVRVGQAMGRSDSAAAGRAGWTALLLGASFMACAAIAFVVFPHAIARAFTIDQRVIETSVALLAVAALFQMFDGIQVVATGALRGTGDTRTAMVVSLLCYWLIGLPVGYALCFVGGKGVVGIWLGLSVGLIGVALTLLRFWARRMRALGDRRGLPSRAALEPVELAAS